MKPYYEKDGIKIFLGDCREVLPTLGKFDLLLTDPPYGIERFKKAGTRIYTKKEIGIGIEWDNKPSKEMFGLLLKSAEKSIIWGANNFELPSSEGFLIWDKQQTVPNFADCEQAYISWKFPAKTYRYSIHKHNQTDKQHVTQKPIGLMTWCIKQAGEPQSILDPFMGSGTTLVAAKLAGIPATGIELEEKYAEIAANRLAQGVLNF